MVSSLRARNWCFTLNNYSEDEVDAIKAFKFQYLIFGYEVGDEGTPHLQGYFRCENAIRLETLKNLNSRAHFEVAKGSAEQNIKYCTKQYNEKLLLNEPWAEFVEIGERPFVKAHGLYTLFFSAQDMNYFLLRQRETL